MATTAVVVVGARTCALERFLHGPTAQKIPTSKQVIGIPIRQITDITMMLVSHPAIERLRVILMEVLQVYPTLHTELQQF